MSEIINDAEFNAATKNAETEATGDVGVYVHKFESPFTFVVGKDEKTVDELTFSFRKLTGRDSLAIENEMQALGKPLIAPEFSGEYLIRMAARACNEKIGSDVLENMPLGDYSKIRNRARSFLLRSGL